MDRSLRTFEILLITCAIALSVAAHFFTVFPFDLKITQELKEEQNPVFVQTMQGVSALGETWIEAVLVGTVMGIFLARHQWPEAVFVLATASSVVLTSVLKVLIGRPRPPSFLGNPKDYFWSVDQYSFPSGHVLFYVVFFGFIAFLAWSHLTGYVRWLIIAMCGFLIVLIAPSRVYLGAHWASDVIGSYVIGALLLVMIILGYLMAVHRYGDKNSSERVLWK
ncbi:MAG: phosphatase PAP2 family protein [Methanoregula sp.]|jgi:undecaprenyl-diphosphatase|nr:phosphatase PAP2 family protein [Methanoregula sp.]